MKLPALIKQTSNDRLNIVVSVCLVLSVAIKLVYTVFRYITDGDYLNTFDYSEFLINFQGGFVRRGLFGEILYQIYSFVHFPIVPVLTFICIVAFILVWVFFWHQFRKQKYCWWIMFSPLFLGFVSFIVRKDYMLYLLLIGCLYILRDTLPTLGKRFWASVLVIFGLFLHEAFIFWGYPIVALLLLSYRKDIIYNRILALLPLFVFLILSIFKGTLDTTYSIIDSWNSIIPGSPLVYVDLNSIGAIGWETMRAVRVHLSSNAVVSNGAYGVVVLPLFVLAAYYLFTNFLAVFTNKTTSENNTVRLTISLLYSSVIICLIPMMTVLSCDNGRVFQYAAVSTFSAFLIVPHETIIAAFPKWYVNFVNRFNDKMNSFLPPSKGLLILLLLLVGMSPVIFSLQTSWTQSVIGSICRPILTVIKRLAICFLH